VVDLNLDQLAWVTVGVGVLALLALLLALALSLRLRKVRREYAVLRGNGSERDIFSALGHSLRKMDVLSERVEDVVRQQLGQATVARNALQKFALVRYDAFEDMGGRLSFSAALLDDHGDGIVITSINGRTETRTYAKPVKGLSSDHNLSDEEREAIAAALGAREIDWAHTPTSQSA
jgi:hypothetical protein